MQKQIINEIRNVNQVESEIKFLDRKIELVIKNRMNLDDVSKPNDFKKEVKVRKAFLSNRGVVEV